MNGEKILNKLNQTDWLLLRIILSKNNYCSTKELKLELFKLFELNQLNKKVSKQYLSQRLNLLILLGLIEKRMDAQNFYCIKEVFKSPVFHIVTGMNDLNYALNRRNKLKE